MYTSSQSNKLLFIVPGSKTGTAPALKNDRLPGRFRYHVSTTAISEGTTLIVATHHIIIALVTREWYQIFLITIVLRLCDNQVFSSRMVSLFNGVKKMSPYYEFYFSPSTTRP